MSQSCDLRQSPIDESPDALQVPGLLPWFFLFFVLNASAQHALTGKVTDGSTDIPFASVALHHSDSTYLTGAICDSNGVFLFTKLKPGVYFIRVTAVGFGSSVQHVTIKNGDHVLETIYLTRITHTLDEVVVHGSKPLVEVRPDRVVINVESSLTFAGNTALEILQKSPGLTVDRHSGTVTINGRPGARVMIDNKIISASLEMVLQMLEGINASEIERIEIMSTPDSRYDAEGGGVIHIITKRNASGTEVSGNVWLGARWAEALGGSFKVTHRGKNWAWFADYSINRNHNLHLLKIERKLYADNFIQTVHVDGRRENSTTLQNLSTGIECDLTDNIQLNAGLSAYERNWKMHSVTTDVNHVVSDSTVTAFMDVHQRNVWQNFSASVGITGRINPKSGFSVNADWLYFHNDNPSHYSNAFYYPATTDSELLDLTKDTPVNILVGAADYNHKVSDRVSFETGVKAVYSTLSNQVIVSRNEEGQWTNDPELSASSSFAERVTAFYVSGKWNPNSTWNISGGIRYEYTDVAMELAHQPSGRRYGYFFPTLHISKTACGDRTFALSYSRRITRPTYNDLAAYSSFWGISTFVSGNTGLWPAISDQVSIGFHWKDWSSTVQYNHTVNAIATLQPTVDLQTNLLTYRSENLSRLAVLSVNEYYSHGLTDWWKVQLTVSGQHMTLYAETRDEKKEARLFSYNAQLGSSWKLPRGFSAELSGFYQSRSASGVVTFLAQGWLNAAIQKKIGLGVLSVAIDDVFNTNSWRTITPFDHSEVRFNYHWNNRFVRMTYSFRLGSKELKTMKFRSGADEERKRVTN